MNDESNDLDRLLRGLTPPAPPPALRELALQGAREVLAAPADLWTRIWESRPLRVAWGLSVALLVVAHAAVTPRPAHRAAPRDGGELAAIGRLPRVNEGARPLVGSLANDDTPEKKGRKS